MEQYQERQKLDIKLNLNGEMEATLPQRELTSDEWILIQQLLDEAKTRSQTRAKLEEIAQQGLFWQGVMGAVAVLMFLFLVSFCTVRVAIASFNSVNLQQVRH
ncbi:hypothetical protein PCC6912_40040 [Chlorogloeopsis fritschii PCC 6912]|uniref:Uncharacterized protein n=1 Tax=Chlorogloeopsis fritschii PCC 6912 TaxID=211165 RepID=A0A3S0Y5J7_CHLFR|nr:hypothetical protein [Chlorogloeopsis fritschii]RUR77045.1 hypothetical protein PCC6912_40040 [Chlorogloeopsis fritschii PCC 6912]